MYRRGTESTSSRFIVLGNLDVMGLKGGGGLAGGRVPRVSFEGPCFWIKEPPLTTYFLFTLLINLTTLGQLMFFCFFSRTLTALFRLPRLTALFAVVSLA